VSGVILFSEYNEAFGLHGPEMWATFIKYAIGIFYKN
jgi:hypothetical protein